MKWSLDPVRFGFKVRAVVIPVGALDVFGARGKRAQGTADAGFPAVVGDQSGDAELGAFFGVFVGGRLGSGTELGGAEEGVVGDDELGGGEGVVGDDGHGACGGEAGGGR